MDTDFTSLVLEMFKKCAGRSGCEVCREHMEEDCLFFPEMYRLHDLAQETGTPLADMDLASLVDLCTLCGLCPCQDIRMLVLKAKAARAEVKKLPLSARLLSDARQIGQWGTAFSSVLNPLNRLTPVTAMTKKVLDIHPERSLPVFPKESFFAWAQKKGLTAPSKHTRREGSKVAYFAGCSAGHLFPDVAKAAVDLLEQNGVQVFVPSQDCCSMPLIMEGNRQEAKKRIQANLETAYYSEAFQHRADAGGNRMQVPTGSRDKKFTTVPMGIYKNILKDDGYFSGIDPLQRIDLSQNVQDLGEYLVARHKTGQLSISLKEPDQPLAYFAPCHQREQHIGHPYVEMIQSLPGTDILPVGGEMHCCGMGGHLGFKADFHGHSLTIGGPLFDRLAAASGRTIITDCLSCRMQLQHVFSRQVFHPLELLTTAKLTNTGSTPAMVQK